MAQELSIAPAAEVAVTDPAHDGVAATGRSESAGPQIVGITIHRGVVVRVLCAITALLIVLQFAAAFVHHELGYDHALGFVPLFDFNLESNVPSWYSSSLLLVAGMVAFAIARATRVHRGRFVAHWVVAGALAVFLSLDEAAMLHELASQALATGGPTADRSWLRMVIVMVLPVLVGAAAYARFLLGIPRTTARGLCIAAAIYLGGAIVVDGLAGPLLPAGSGPWARVLMHTIEEALEMLGVIAVIAVLLAHLARLDRDATGVPRLGR